MVDSGSNISALHSCAITTPVFGVPAAPGIVSRWGLGSLPLEFSHSCGPHLVLDPYRPPKVLPLRWPVWGDASIEVLPLLWAVYSDGCFTRLPAASLQVSVRAVVGTSKVANMTASPGRSACSAQLSGSCQVQRRSVCSHLWGW